MRILYILGIVFTILTSMWLYHRFCCDCGIAAAASKSRQEPIAVPVSPTKVKTGSDAIMKNEGFTFKHATGVYQCKNQLLFPQKGFAPAMPFSDSVRIGLDLLKNQIKQNPNQAIEIVGEYTSAEPNTSSMPTMGMARALQIKNYMQQQGVDVSQLVLKDKLVANQVFRNDTLIGSIALSMIAKPAGNEAQLAEISKSLSAKPITLYFETGASNINLDENQKKQFADLIYYLDQKPDATVSSIGHTDNVGNKDKNMEIGKNRAAFAKDFLIKNGVPAAKIQVDSKGPDQPIADNATTEGKAKNRRVEIKIQ